MSRGTTFSTRLHVRQSKTLTSLCICADWSGHMYGLVRVFVCPRPEDALDPWLHTGLSWRNCYGIRGNNVLDDTSVSYKNYYLMTSSQSQSWVKLFHNDIFVLFSLY